jgi:hypothetical protein
VYEVDPGRKLSRIGREDELLVIGTSTVEPILLQAASSAVS